MPNKKKSDTDEDWVLVEKPYKTKKGKHYKTPLKKKVFHKNPPPSPKEPTKKFRWQKGELLGFGGLCFKIYID